MKDELNEPPDPLLFWETVNGYQRTAALRAAVDLGLFSAIGRSAESPSVLAKRCHASERGIRILCDYLVVLGILQKSGQEYRLTPMSTSFLHKDSPAYLGGVLPFLNSDRAFDAFSELTEAVRRGGTALNGAGYMNYQDPIWVNLARSMPPIVMPAVEFIATIVNDRFSHARRVLDLAAGHGLFGIHIAQKVSDAEIFAQDWPNVLAVAEENARAAGIADSRYHLLPGDTFNTAYPDSCDIVLVTNLLHHFDLGTCGRLLDRIHAAVRPGGAVITLEFIPNPDWVSPPVSATFSLMMLGLTPGGDAYTYEQLNQLFTSRDFSANELLPVPGSPQHVIISHKPSAAA